MDLLNNRFSKNHRFPAPRPRPRNRHRILLEFLSTPPWTTKEGTGVLKEQRGGVNAVGSDLFGVWIQKTCIFGPSKSTTNFYELVILTEQIILTTRNTPIY